MTTPNLAARRATIEDLQKLTPLWVGAGLDAEELGKRLQEFQVVEGTGGEIVGALGMQIDGQQARLHSEAFSQPEEAAAIRAKLWERVQMVSKNHGFVRLWTQLDPAAWGQNGFQAPTADATAKLPAAFAGQPEPWLCLQLRDDAALAPSVEKEFALFKEMQQEETQRIFRQAKLMKIVAAVVVLAVFTLVAVWIVAWMKAQGARGR
jgi:hypothetical protein